MSILVSFKFNYSTNNFQNFDFLMQEIKCATDTVNIGKELRA